MESAAQAFPVWRNLPAGERGMVGLNTCSISVEAAPFGGAKLSGFGREGGREGIEEYLATKTFHWGALELDRPTSARLPRLRFRLSPQIGAF